MSFLPKFGFSELLDAPAERVIAHGRVLLAMISLIAVWMDPSRPAEYALITMGILFAYCVYAYALVILALSRSFRGYVQLGIHVIDIVVIASLVFFTDWTNNPFFVFFTFILLAAAMRWSWGGVLLTVLMLVGLLLIADLAELAIAATIDVQSKQLEINRAIIRCAYLVVAAGMLAYVSAHRERRGERLAQLAEWPTSELDNPAMAATLDHATRILDAPRVLVIWEQTEVPFLQVALRDKDGFHHTRDATGRFGSLVQAELTQSAFMTTNAAPNRARLAHGPGLRADSLLDADLIARFQISSVATAPFKGNTCSGRVFVLDCDSWSDDHLLLTEIVAARIGMELDSLVLQMRSEQAAADRERLRLIRDLHDGVLQSLTAANLQLELSSRQSTEDAQPRLDLIKQLLRREQARIRSYIRDVRLATQPSGDVSIVQCLDPLLNEAAAEWNCETSLRVEPNDARMSTALGRQLSLIIREAIANAVRHGGASSVDVRLERSDPQLTLWIQDNGSGFGEGSADGQPPAFGQTARPVSLTERVQELGGSLVAATSVKGVQLQIGVPLT